MIVSFHGSRYNPNEKAEAKAEGETEEPLHVGFTQCHLHHPAKKRPFYGCYVYHGSCLSAFPHYHIGFTVQTLCDRSSCFATGQKPQHLDNHQQNQKDVEH